ncbi:family 43 glycosylhydrolase [Caulobacter segnis]
MSCGSARISIWSSSTFAWFPGLPIHHSTDLVHWEQIGNALDRPGMLDFKRLGLSRAVFAPAITHHDEAVLASSNTCVDCGGNFTGHRQGPEGAVVGPGVAAGGGRHRRLAVLRRGDGRAWIVNNDNPPGPAEYQGHRAIWIQEYDPKAQKTIGSRSVLLDKGVNPAAKPIWPEGPRILKKDGWYYLVAAEGGTAEGHSQVVLRAKAVTGPYVPYKDNPILTQRGLPKDRPLPITSAGHADLVDTPDGQWWATFLAVRPYGDDLYNTGRETFLLPVEMEGRLAGHPAERPDHPVCEDCAQAAGLQDRSDLRPVPRGRDLRRARAAQGVDDHAHPQLALVERQGRDAQHRGPQGPHRRQ